MDLYKAGFKLAGQKAKAISGFVFCELLIVSIFAAVNSDIWSGIRFSLIFFASVIFLPELLRQAIYFIFLPYTILRELVLRHVSVDHRINFWIRSTSREYNLRIATKLFCYILITAVITTDFKQYLPASIAGAVYLLAIRLRAEFRHYKAEEVAYQEKLTTALQRTAS